MVLEVGVPAEVEGVLVGGHNPGEGGPEAAVPTEAAQTDQGTAPEEEVYPHVGDQPEEGGGLGLEVGGQEDQEEQGGLGGAVGDPAYHQESEVVALPDQVDQGSGLGLGVPGTCPCLPSPWGTHGTRRAAQPYPPQTSVPTECLSFSGTASQTGSGTVCYMA